MAPGSCVPQFDDLATLVLGDGSGTPLAQLQRAVDVAGELAGTADDLVDHFIDGARRAGCSWAEIGAVLGVSRQGAQQRFSDLPSSGRECDEEQTPVTARGRRALRQAVREARRAGTPEVHPSHLLLAVLRDPRALATHVLTAMGVAADEVEARLQPGASTGARRGASARFSPSTSAVLGRAVREARELGHDSVGTEHLLLALLVEPSAARDVVVSLGAGYDAARRHVLDALEGPRADARGRRIRAATRRTARQTGIRP